MHTRLQPADWSKPSGYTNGVLARGQELIFVAGQIGWNAQGQFETADFAAQVRQALENTVQVLEQAGAGPEHIVRMTWYITDKRAYKANLDRIGSAYREIMGRHFPPMSVVQVAGLIEDEAQVEIEVTAVK